MNKQAISCLFIRPQRSLKSFAFPPTNANSTPLDSKITPVRERVVTLVPFTLHVGAIHKGTLRPQTDVGERNAKR